jgi:hypothetical protein
VRKARMEAKILFIFRLGEQFGDFVILKKGSTILLWATDSKCLAIRARHKDASKENILHFGN